MDYPGGMYRPAHPQDQQNMPPPPNFQPPGMHRDQGMNGNLMYRGSPQIPSRMSAGYHPPINDSHNLSSVMSSQEQGMPPFPGHLQGSGAHRGYHPSPMANHVNPRPTQNSSRFRSDPGGNSTPHNYHSQMPPHGLHQTPPHTRGNFPGHNQLQSDFHNMHQSPMNHANTHPQSSDNEFNHQDNNHHDHPSNVMPPDFHPLQQNSMLGNFNPHRQNDFIQNDQNVSHPADFPFVEQNTIGMQNMMIGDHMLGGGDGYNQHQYPMYDHEVRENEFVHMGYQLMDKHIPSSITSVNFDYHHELVWAGNQRGYVASYYGQEFQKYSGYRVSMDEDVRMNLSFPQGVLSLTPNTLRGTLRRGIPVFTFKDPHLHDMQCMMMRGAESVLIGGHHKHVLEVDIIRNCLSNVYEVGDAGIAIFRHTDRFLCGGDSTGKVHIYDKNTMRSTHTLEAHTSCLSDFDVHDNLLITCGFTNRMNALTPDRLLRVYDMRVMRAMAPIQVSCDPTFLRFVPSMLNNIIVVSQMGSFQLVDITSGPQNSQLAYPINTNGSPVIAFDISSTSQSLCFGDSSGHVHLFSTGGQNSSFNQFSQPVEFADPSNLEHSIDVNDEMGIYSSIPMPYPRHGGPLVSDFPESMMKQVYRKQRPMPHDMMRNVTNVDNIGYTTNITKKRNVVPYELKKGSKENNSNVPESPIGRGDDPFLIVPKRYRRVEIKYSKLGVEDFDFRHYNKTNLAGLEPHIPNAYCNSMVQVLYFLEPLRAALLSHVCRREFCLSCELGFLFHMLDSQKGKTCQATNFLRAFRTMSEVSALGLVLHDIDENRQDFPRLIQSWQRFVLMQIHKELSTDPTDKDSKDGANGNEQKSKDLSNEKNAEDKKSEEKTDREGPEKTLDQNDTHPTVDSSEEPHGNQLMCKSIIRDLLGVKIKINLQCKCGLENEKFIDQTHINLVYPDFKQTPNFTPFAVSFGEVVQNSMVPVTNIQTWCPTCNRYMHHCQRKSIQNMPDVLALNCHTENEKNLEFWKSQFKIVRERFSDVDQPSAMIRPSSNTKKCRFGNACHRPDCIFAHDGPRECDAKKKQEPKEDDEFGPSWIPMGLKVVMNADGSVDVTEISDEEPLPSKEEDNVRYYELYSVVSNIVTSSSSNLVCCLKGSEPYHQRKEHVTCTQWYLINDFCITPVEKDEAVDFKLDWNIPCIIHYTRRNFITNHDTTVKNWSSPDIILNDTALLNPERRILTYKPLEGVEDLPVKGDIVALDAEFVSLKEEEQQLRSDGTSSTSLPAQMSVARITCIRGSGPHQGEPFIDDYINIEEQVVDYLTQWSGIQGGDLCKLQSKKHLTTLKSTYLKLRYLLDTGVIFVGHGLKKDFRVINILVPKGQVMDTVDIYHLPRQRYISLKFLAWYFLKTNIQSSSHDSNEDARTALNLYLLYKKMQEEDKDKVLTTIKELYEAGRKICWKIPDVKGGKGTEQTTETSEADFL